MKRIVLLLLSLVLILSVSVPVLAAADPAEPAELTPEEEFAKTAILSEDLQQVQIGDKTYVRFDSSRLQDIHWDVIYITAELSETQQQTIKKVDIRNYFTSDALAVTIYYKDGSELSADFICQDQLATYEELLVTDNCQVDFNFPEGNIIEISLDAARGTEEILFREDLYYFSGYEVNAVESEVWCVSRGMLLIRDDTYYFVDYDQISTTNIYENSRVTAWLITDEDLCADIAQAMDQYHQGLGVLEDDDFSEAVSRVFLIAMFVVLPAIVLILFLVLAIIAKTPVYKKLFWNLCAWSGVLLIFVGIIAAVVEFY